MIVLRESAVAVGDPDPIPVIRPIEVAMPIVWAGSAHVGDRARCGGAHLAPPVHESEVIELVVDAAMAVVGVSTARVVEQSSRRIEVHVVDDQEPVVKLTRERPGILGIGLRSARSKPAGRARRAFDGPCREHVERVGDASGTRRRGVRRDARRCQGARLGHRGPGWKQEQEWHDVPYPLQETGA